MVAQEFLSADHQTVDSPENRSVGPNTSEDVKPKSDNGITQSKDERAPIVKKKKKAIRGGIIDAIRLGIFTMATAFVAAAMRGDWIILLVHILKHWHPDYQELTPSAQSDTASPAKNFSESDTASPAKNFLDYFENAHLFIVLSWVVSSVTFYGLAGYWQYAYYIKRKEEAHEWKCQPTRWLTAENERHEIMLGTFNIAFGGIISGFASAYILNGGPCSMYFSPGEHGYVYLVVSTVLVFLFQDGVAYYIHRLMHIPLLYKTIHKHHHRYHSPTAFSSTAFHPIEFTIYQCVFASPMFFVPIYSGAFIMLLFYGYYYGMIDHSGIMMDSIWPWQPESIYHDDHHKYFHTNFGFNTKLWDWAHDTMRLDSRVYGEDTFYGKGKSKEE